MRDDSDPAERAPSDRDSDANLDPDASHDADDRDETRGRQRPDGATEGTVRTNGVDTYYVRRGTGPPVVFVHGMATGARQWDPQATALADRYTTVAYDVRGHGRTGGSDRSPYSMDLYAEDLDALVRALDLDRPVVCGLSMGGCIAQAYAAAHPDRVAGLVLADTFTAAPLSATGRLLFWNLRLLGRLDRVVRYTTLNRLQTWVWDRLAPGVAGDRTTVQSVMEATPRMSHAEFRKVARSVAAFPSSNLDLSGVSVPVLVAHGEHVPPVLRRMHVRLAGEFDAADVSVAVVPDAGHASNLDNPEAFTATVRSFLQGVPSHAVAG